jgi:hypothetical protein
MEALAQQDRFQARPPESYLYLNFRWEGTPLATNYLTASRGRLFFWALFFLLFLIVILLFLIVDRQAAFATGRQHSTEKHRTSGADCWPEVSHHPALRHPAVALHLHRRIRSPEQSTAES